MNDKKQNSDLDGRELPLVLLLGGGALWYKYGHTVQVWFHQNLITVLVGAMAALTILGYFLMRRMTKKNQQEIERLRGLNSARPPTTNQHDYYQRRNRNKERNIE